VSELIKSFRADIMSELGGLRQMMMELRPPVLEERGLGPALEEILRNGFEPHGVAWSLELSCERHLPEHVEIVLYRLVDEAIRNTLKYAHARRAEVCISERSGLVRGQFSDDGDGFDTSVLPKRLEDGHYGLPSMRERVELGGGRFSLRSEPGQGTIIDVVLPLGSADQEGAHAEGHSVWTRLEAKSSTPPPAAEETA
jgi:signal transduction histidine kinase